jgi:hypothetical protein
MAATHKQSLSDCSKTKEVSSKKMMQQKSMAAQHHCRWVETNPTASHQHDDNSTLRTLVGSGGGRLRAPSHPDRYEKIVRRMGVEEVEVISLVFLIWALAANRKLEVGEGVNE